MIEKEYEIVENVWISRIVTRSYRFNQVYKVPNFWVPRDRPCIVYGLVSWDVCARGCGSMLRNRASKKKICESKIHVFEIGLEKDVNLRFMVELEQLFWGDGNPK